MITFYDLSAQLKTLFSALFFLALCGGVCLLCTMFNRRARNLKIVILLCTIACAVPTVFYMTEIRAVKQNKASVAISSDFASLPLFIPALVLALSVALYIYFVIRESKYRKGNLTRLSIKESFDKISSGLCFYQKSGRIILVNRRMNSLCHAIAGRDLQNADLFWEILTMGEVAQGVTRLTDGFNPILQLSDGTVWAFSQKEIGDIVQLSASDITQLHLITNELEEKNVHLAELNARLKKYGENVDELTRNKERLEVKARIHRELGQALLASRRFLLSEEETHQGILKLWHDNIAMLRMEAQIREDEAPLDMLSRMISQTGIACDIVGQIPNDSKVQRMFVQAAAEALTNAISHAEAKTLFVKLTETDEYYTAQYTNDGVIPESAIIKEGGGLSSLRKKIENEGGIMTVTGSPCFMLTVMFAKGKGKEEWSVS